MSNQEVGQTGTVERPVEQSQSTETPRPTTPLPPEQSERQAAQQPWPPPYPPYARPPYYPGSGPQPVYGPYYGPPYAPPRHRHSPWPWIILTVVLVLVFTGVLGMFAAIGYNFPGYTSSTPETRYFTVTANPTIVINNDTGNIQVQAGGTGNNVTFLATKHAAFGSNVNDVQVIYNQASEANTITINIERTTSFNFFNSPSVDFNVTVPSNAALNLKTNTGGIDISGVSGRMSLTSNTGSVSARDGTLTSSSLLTSNTGSITFTGSIDKTGAYQFTTNTGSVNVTLPASSVFHVDATTDTGSITSDIPGVSVQHPNFTGAIAHGDVGSSPQAMVTLRTNTGSIYLHQS
jgi:hypothetical protein